MEQPLTTERLMPQRLTVPRTKKNGDNNKLYFNTVIANSNCLK